MLSKNYYPNHNIFSTHHWVHNLNPNKSYPVNSRGSSSAKAGTAIKHANVIAKNFIRFITFSIKNFAAKVKGKIKKRKELSDFG